MTDRFFNVSEDLGRIRDNPGSKKRFGEKSYFSNATGNFTDFRFNCGSGFRDRYMLSTRLHFIEIGKALRVTRAVNNG